VRSPSRRVLTPNLASPKPRKLYGSCLYADCGKNYITTTRTGSKVTCPHCKRAQPGPSVVAVRLGLVPDPHAKPVKPAATIDKVPPAPAAPPAPRVKVTRAGPPVGPPAKTPAVASSPTPAPVAPPAAPPAAPDPPKVGILDKIWFGT
jgi:hypothetical protein